MSIRNAAKAVIISEDKILLNLCDDPTLGIYYDLPGGGQHQFETIEEAVKRECLEETGYSVTPVSFLALCEEIYDNEYLRTKYPDYTHRIYHIFLCTVDDVTPCVPSETDWSQTAVEWVDIKDVSRLALLYPRALRNNLEELINGAAPRFLGCDRIKDRW